MAAKLSSPSLLRCSKMKKEGNDNVTAITFWATLQEKKMKKATAATSTLEEEEEEEGFRV